MIFCAGLALGFFLGMAFLTTLVIWELRDEMRKK